MFTSLLQADKIIENYSFPFYSINCGIDLAVFTSSDSVRVSRRNLFLTGPVDGSPVNISVASLTMRSALVAWQLPLYVVMSRKETYQMKLLLSKQGEKNIYEFRSDHYNRIIKELDLYTAYCVSVLVSHSIRDGPWSECVSFTTPSGILLFCLLEKFFKPILFLDYFGNRYIVG